MPPPPPSPPPVCIYVQYIYIIKELVLKQCSKFYASGGNIAKLRGKQGCKKHFGKRERELEIKIRGWGGGTLATHG